MRAAITNQLKWRATGTPKGRPTGSWPFMGGPAFPPRTRPRQSVPTGSRAREVPRLRLGGGLDVPDVVPVCPTPRTRGVLHPEVFGAALEDRHDFALAKRPHGMCG